jgi:prepilin-type N-terminal cleavage/methylation domain-containing protein
MPKLATGNVSLAASRGLSLIETLVVLVIASVLATVVTLRLGPSNEKEGLTQILKAVALAVEASCERAMFQSEVYALTIEPTGLTRSLYPPLPVTGPASDSNIRPPDRLVVWEQDIEVSLQVDGYGVDLSARDERAGEPHLLCGSMGDRTPFVLTLRAKGIGAQLQMPIFGEWMIVDV